MVSDVIGAAGIVPYFYKMLPGSVACFGDGNRGVGQKSFGNIFAGLSSRGPGDTSGTQ